MPEGHRQQVAFMVLSSNGGIICFDRTVEWVRTVSAASFSHTAGRPSVRLGVYGHQTVAAGLKLAVAAAMDTARAFKAFETLSFSVGATAWDVPCLVDERGAVSAIPEHWILQDDDLVSEWVSGMERGLRPSLEDAVRLCAIERESATVWSSNRTEAANQAALDAFAAGVRTPKEAAEELQSAPAARR